MKLGVFIPYYGSKWRMACKYDSPQYDTIIEPFAGGAGYSLNHADKNVILLEKYELLVSLWAWLIRVSSRDIRSIPLNVETTDDVHLCQEAQWLVGFWLNRASAQPKKSKSKTFKCGWTKGVSERLAEQVEYIRHWQVFKADFESIDTEIAPEATWFIDPPYQQAGKYYRHSSKSIDYSRLASFCQQAKGQVIVCENAGADWLPFEPFGIFGAQSHNGARKSVEVIWRKRP